MDAELELVGIKPVAAVDGFSSGQADGTVERCGSDFIGVDEARRSCGTAGNDAGLAGRLRGETLRDVRLGHRILPTIGQTVDQQRLPVGDLEDSLTLVVEAQGEPVALNVALDVLDYSVEILVSRVGHDDLEGELRGGVVLLVDTFRNSNVLADGERTWELFEKQPVVAQVRVDDASRLFVHPLWRDHGRCGVSFIARFLVAEILDVRQARLTGFDIGVAGCIEANRISQEGQTA